MSHKLHGYYGIFEIVLIDSLDLKGRLGRDEEDMECALKISQGDRRLFVNISKGKMFFVEFLVGERFVP